MLTFSDRYFKTAIKNTSMSNYEHIWNKLKERERKTIPTK